MWEVGFSPVHTLFETPLEAYLLSTINSDSHDTPIPIRIHSPSPTRMRIRTSHSPIPVNQHSRQRKTESWLDSKDPPQSRIQPLNVRSAGDASMAMYIADV